ncbi:hypothetical protein CUMW_044540 [Citrus unshiu]|nr:hypothetical protein CUMW_044540 [Citrus unshiu]GAY39468.1 hypothetical protein CUMW_044540 [Citrus unshiu]GAY39469.1 hypothetical protein CUMW_044540 [Citrus unshiu]
MNKMQSSGSDSSQDQQNQRQQQQPPPPQQQPWMAMQLPPLRLFAISRQDCQKVMDLWNFLPMQQLRKFCRAILAF